MLSTMDAHATVAKAMLEWFHTHLLTVILTGSLSLVVFVGALIAVPLMLIRMPADYFRADRRSRPRIRKVHPLISIVTVGAKNTMGVVLVAAGIFMLVTPGQGVLTILMGLALTNFPGKYRAERWLISRKPVFRCANWVRRKANTPKLLHP